MRRGQSEAQTDWKGRREAAFLIATQRDASLKKVAAAVALWVDHWRFPF